MHLLDVLLHPIAFSLQLAHLLERPVYCHSFSSSHSWTKLLLAALSAPMAHPAIVIASSTLPHASQGCNQRGLPRGAAHVMQRRLRNGDVTEPPLSTCCPSLWRPWRRYSNPAGASHVQVVCLHARINRGFCMLIPGMA